jgi:hypothetical protein
VVRAGVKTVATTVALPSSLSPWGDNNPVTLPNVRKRDAALAIVGHGVADSLAPGALELTEEVLKFGATQAGESVVDETHQKLRPGKGSNVVRKGAVAQVQVRIRHKLMGVDADIRFVGTRATAQSTAYDKGWFCPFLFASGRTPKIPRADDFTVATFFGPGLKGV